MENRIVLENRITFHSFYFVGAIYTTTNGGLNWKAQVKETIDATLNRYVFSTTYDYSYI